MFIINHIQMDILPKIMKDFRAVILGKYKNTTTTLLMYRFYDSNRISIKKENYFMKGGRNMSKLDYSHLIHREEPPVKGYTRKESFYLQKGNGRAGSYRGPYKGDFAVFRATRQTCNYLSDEETRIDGDER